MEYQFVTLKYLIYLTKNSTYYVYIVNTKAIVYTNDCLLKIGTVRPSRVTNK